MALHVERRLEGVGNEAKLILKFRGEAVRQAFFSAPITAEFGESRPPYRSESRESLASSSLDTVDESPVGKKARHIEGGQSAIVQHPWHLPAGIPSSPTWSIGHVIWVKLPTFPWWPAQIQEPPLGQAKTRPANEVFVVFYGTHDYAWVALKDCAPFAAASPNYAQFAGNKNKGLQRAIDQAWVALGQTRPDRP